MALVLPLMLFVHETYAALLLLSYCFLCLFESFIFPNASTLVSNLSDKGEQGEVLGIHNSIQWAAIGFVPLFSGSAVALIPHLPITVATVAMLCAAAVFFKSIQKEQAAPHRVVLKYLHATFSPSIEGDSMVTSPKKRNRHV